MTGVPETVFIDRHKVIVHKVIRELTEQTLDSNLQKTERESPVAFMPGMNRRSFEGGGDEGEAERRPKRLLTTTSGSAMMRKDVLSE